MCVYGIYEIFVWGRVNLTFVYYRLTYLDFIKGKVKVIPLQARCGPEGG